MFYSLLECVFSWRKDGMVRHPGKAVPSCTTFIKCDISFHGSWQEERSQWQADSCKSDRLCPVAGKPHIAAQRMPTTKKPMAPSLCAPTLEKFWWVPTFLQQLLRRCLLPDWDTSETLSIHPSEYQIPLRSIWTYHWWGWRWSIENRAAHVWTLFPQKARITCTI